MTSVAIVVLPHGEGIPLPAYQTAGSAGCDLRAANVDDISLPPGQSALVPCGFKMALPRGFEAQVRPRSGLAIRHGVTVLNAPGTIDSDYRGEVKVALINHGPDDFRIVRGERIAQLVIAPVTQVDWQQEQTLGATERGEGGFGSTGR